MTESKSRFDTSLSADIAIFTVHEDELKILLVKRAHAPFKDKWALPGGFRKIGVDKSIEDVAMRRIKEETGVKAPYLEQLYTFSDNKRDPRGWVTSVAYFAFMPYDKAVLVAGEGVSKVQWRSVRDGKVGIDMAFDHNKIVSVAVDRVRSKMQYSSIAAHVLNTEFTLPQLQRIYEIILACDLDKTYFRRSIKKADIVVETDKYEESKGRRRARLYTFKKGSDKKLFFPRGITTSTDNR